MTKTFKLAIAAATAFTFGSVAPAFAASGIFGAGVILSTNSNGPTLYEFTQSGFTSLGDSRYSPPASSPGDTLGTPAFDTSGGFSAGTQNLGTFDPSLGNSLTFDGGELLSFKNGGSNVTGANIYYQINALGFSSATPLVFNQDNVSGNGGDQRWYVDSANINLLTGLANGTYTLSVYLDSPSSDGTHFANNNGSPNNYKASFTVVPEPSTLALVLSSSLFGTFYLLRRRRL